MASKIISNFNDLNYRDHEFVEGINSVCNDCLKEIDSKKHNVTMTSEFSLVAIQKIDVLLLDIQRILTLNN